MAASIIASVLDVSLGLTPFGDAAPVDAAQWGPISGLVSLLSIWPSLAGAIKRLHDRDRSGWWIGGFYLLSAIVVVVGVLAAMSMQHGGPMMGAPVIVGGLVLAAYALWLLVETGFLRGTPGPNRFGPDFLGGQGQPQWQQAQGWPPQQPPPGQWQPQWQPPQGQGGYPPQQGWQPPPQGYPPPGYGQPPQQPGYGAPPPGYGPPPQGPGQPPAPGQWSGPGSGGSVPPVRRD